LVFSSNGHLFVEYDAFTGKTSAPRPLSAFPSPDELRRRYEQGKGFRLDSAAAARTLLSALRWKNLAHGEQRALKAAGGSCSAPESAQLGAVVQFMHPPGRARSSPLNLPGRR